MIYVINDGSSNRKPSNVLVCYQDISNIYTMPLRSLAFIALFAVVAVLTDSIGYKNCVDREIGSEGNHILEYADNIPYGKTTENFYKRSCRPFKWVGEKLHVCNKNDNTDLPSIDGPPEGKLTPVDITCKDHDGCAFFYVYQCKGNLPF